MRSRRLVAPSGDTTRPTSDRVREALFSILTSQNVFDSPPRVLDLYAGSGALGFEALSRGASHVVFVEQGRPALTVIRQNAAALSVETESTILGTKVERALPTLKDEEMDLVLIDPPYADVRSPPFLEILSGAARLLAASGILVLEHSSGDSPPTVSTLSPLPTRIYGDTALTLFEKSKM